MGTVVNSTQNPTDCIRRLNAVFSLRPYLEVLMYRSLAGFRAQYHHLTLLVVSELNEWKVLIYGPGVIINGTRQFSEAKAKEHALTVAQNYLQEEKHAQLPALAAVEWTPTTHDDWLVWRT